MRAEAVKRYQKWLDNRHNLPDWIAKKLPKMSEIEIDSFFSEEKIEFGTAGVRGIMNPGTSNFNELTVKKITLGFIEFLKKNHSKSALIHKGVIIMCDGRKNSSAFAELITKTLIEKRITPWIFKNFPPLPTPFCTYLIKKMNMAAGIVITASHNAAKYNGYKLYNDKAQQYMISETDEITSYINNQPIDFKWKYKLKEEDKSLIKQIDESWKDSYLNDIKKLQFYPSPNHDIKILYSNLHGVGKNFTDKILIECNYKVDIVENQYQYDGEFPTVKVPNPEVPQSFESAFNKASKTKPDIILLNDADSDRLGVAVFHKNNYTILNGNQIGIILLYYLLESYAITQTFPTNPRVYFTLISTDLGEEIANKYKCEVTRVLPGFKWITDQVLADKKKDKTNLILAYEESNGYWINSDITHEKDGIQAALVFAEAADYYLKQNKTIMDVLEEIFVRFGYYYNKTESVDFNQIEFHKIEKIMKMFRENTFTKIAEFNITKKEDYLIEKFPFPKCDLIKFYFADKSWFGVRPSGTEPKIKFYFVIRDKYSLENAVKKKEKIWASVQKIYSALF